MINKYSVVNTSNVQSNNIMYFVGAGLILTAIPIKIGLSKKIKKAVLLMNEDLKTPKTSFNIESTSFISNSNGFGISITCLHKKSPNQFKRNGYFRNHGIYECLDGCHQT
jgi:hypothetical protein